MNNNIQIFDNDLPSEIDLSNEKVIGIDCEALGLTLGRDPLTLVQLGLVSKKFYLIKLNRETYEAPNLINILSNPSIQFWSYTKDGEVVISRRDKARFYTRFLPEFGVYNLDMGMNVDGALTHTLVFKRGNRCQDISPSTLQTITHKVLTFLAASFSSWFLHWFSHKCRVFNFLSGHRLHHKEKTT